MKLSLGAKHFPCSKQPYPYPFRASLCPLGVCKNFKFQITFNSDFDIARVEILKFKVEIVVKNWRMSELKSKPSGFRFLFWFQFRFQIFRIQKSEWHVTWHLFLCDNAIFSSLVKKMHFISYPFFTVPSMTQSPLFPILSHFLISQSLKTQTHASHYCLSPCPISFF